MARHPIDSEELIRCDCCGEITWCSAEKPLRYPWRTFSHSGWIGDFHACCDICEQRYRQGNCK